MQTVDAAHKYLLMTQFFRGQMSRSERARLLRDNHIAYVFWPKGHTLQPPPELVSRQVFDSPQVMLLRVDNRS